MKICKDCQQSKLTTEFYKGQNDCKECYRAKVRKNRNETRRDYYAAYDKARAKTPERRAYRKRALLIERANNPIAIKARRAVAYALRAGNIQKEPCHCGETKVEAHHPDYSKQLFVIWLCNKHHKHVHERVAY